MPCNQSEDYADSLWDGLASLCSRSKLRCKLELRQAGDDLKRDLMYFPAVHHLGFARGRTDYCSRKNFPFQSIAAIGAKEALWRLYRAEYHVAIFVHDECVVSVPGKSELDVHGRKIAQIMEQAMATFLNELSVTVETDEPRKSWGQGEDVPRSGPRPLQDRKPTAGPGQVSLAETAERQAEAMCNNDKLVPRSQPDE